MVSQSKVKKNKRVIFSFFAGVGFLDLGFEISGFDIGFVNEINEPFLKAYKFARQSMHFHETLYGYHHGDMGELTKGLGKDRLSKIVRSVRKQNSLIGFIGGPPCPDFSIAGKNLGQHGQHGKLSSTYISLIKQQKPDFFLFENVKGLWKTRSHRLFYETLKVQLRKSGYIMTERLINALEYGVPQDRDRIILVGFKKELIPSGFIDESNENSLFENVFPWNDYIKYPREKIFAMYKKVKASYEEPLTAKPRGIPKETTVEYWFNKNAVTNHPNSKHHFRPRQAAHRFLETKEGDVSRKSFKRLHRWRYSPTVAYGNNEVHIHPTEPRRISVAEALSLQSLPKEFVLPDTMTLSDMFKAIGNGVPFIAARSVAQTINKFLDTL